MWNEIGIAAVWMALSFMLMGFHRVIFRPVYQLISEQKLGVQILFLPPL